MIKPLSGFIDMSTTHKQVTKTLKRRLISRVFSFVKPYQNLFYGVILLTLVIAMLEPSRPYMVQLAIDRYVISHNEVGLFKMIVLMLVLLVVETVAQYFLIYLSEWLGEHVVRDLRIKIYSHVLQLNATFHNRTPVGRLVTRTIADTGKLLDVFSQGLAAVLADVLQLIAMAGFMLYINWWLALLSLLTVPLLVMSAYVFKTKVKHAYTLGNEAIVKFTAFIQSRLADMQLVQIFNRQAVELDKFKLLNKAYRQTSMQANVYSGLYFSSLEIMRALATSLLIWYGARGILAGVTTLGSLTAFLMYIKMFFRPVSHLAEHFNILQMGLVSADRVIELLDTNERVENKPTCVVQSIQGQVTFEGVWFSYHGQGYALKNISFDIPVKKSLAIVGSTGAGKSTVINLLARFYDPQKGVIKIDGIDMLAYDLAVLRRHIGLVLQDVFLFSASIYDNITLGDDRIAPETVVEAARMVGIHDFFQSLPGGYQFQVGERGVALSMGQRQLLAFVRVLVYNPAILVLDEATAALDPATELLVQEATKKLLNNRTAIIIAHRLATIQDADSILVLDQGEIKEQGTHQSLLAQNGHYASLYKTKLQVA